jgi:hypothetical protein
MNTIWTFPGRRPSNVTAKLITSLNNNIGSICRLYKIIIRKQRLNQIITIGLHLLLTLRITRDGTV